MVERVYVRNVASDAFANVGASESEGLFLRELSFDAYPERSAPAIGVEKVFPPKEYKALLVRGFYEREVP